jgi:hypothetical protein
MLVSLVGGALTFCSAWSPSMADFMPRSRINRTELLDLTGYCYMRPVVHRGPISYPMAHPGSIWAHGGYLRARYKDGMGGLPVGHSEEDYSCMLAARV